MVWGPWAARKENISWASPFMDFWLQTQTYLATTDFMSSSPRCKPLLLSMAISQVFYQRNRQRSWDDTLVPKVVGHHCGLALTRSGLFWAAGAATRGLFLIFHYFLLFMIPSISSYLFSLPFRKWTHNLFYVTRALILRLVVCVCMCVNLNWGNVSIRLAWEVLCWLVIDVDGSADCGQCHPMPQLMGLCYFI